MEKWFSLLRLHGFLSSVLSILSILTLSILSILVGEASKAGKRSETRIPLALRVKDYRSWEERESTSVTGGCDGEVDSGLWIERRRIEASDEIPHPAKRRRNGAPACKLFHNNGFAGWATRRNGVRVNAQTSLPAIWVTRP